MKLLQDVDVCSFKEIKLKPSSINFKRMAHADQKWRLCSSPPESLEVYGKSRLPGLGCSVSNWIPVAVRHLIIFIPNPALPLDRFIHSAAPDTLNDFCTYHSVWMKSVYHCYPVLNLGKAEQDLSIWESYLKCFFPKQRLATSRLAVLRKTSCTQDLMGLPWPAYKSVSLFMIHKLIQIPVKVLESFDPRELKLVAKWYKTVQF